MAETAYVGLGSNLGDRLGRLSAAVESLGAAEGLVVRAISPVYETDPVGYVDQPAFLNAVVAVEASTSPPQVLQVLQRIEAANDRQRDVRWGPRTLDLDLLIQGDRVCSSVDLTLPHPRLAERCFVLLPLLDLDPDLRHPASARPLREYAEALGCAAQVRRWPQAITSG